LAYQLLSTFKTWEITDVFERDMSFDVFLVAINALFVPWKLGFRYNVSSDWVRDLCLVVAVAHLPLVFRMSSIFYVLNASSPYARALISYCIYWKN